MAQLHRQKLHILIQNKTIFFLHTRDKSKVRARDVKRNKIKTGKLPKSPNGLAIPFCRKWMAGWMYPVTHSRQPFHNIHVSNTNNINPSIQNRLNRIRQKRHNASSRAKTTFLTYILIYIVYAFYFYFIFQIKLASSPVSMRAKRHSYIHAPETQGAAVYFAVLRHHNVLIRSL